MNGNLTADGAVSERHWWRHMSRDLYREPNVTALDEKHLIKIRGTAAADRVLRTGLETTSFIWGKPNACAA